MAYYVEGRVYCKPPRTFASHKFDYTVDLTHSELASAKFMTAMQTQIPITIVHDREVIAEQQVYDSGRKCTGTEMSKALGKDAVAGTVERYWFNEKDNAWMVGFVLSPTVSDITRGLIDSGYYKLSLTHQRRDGEVLPVAVGLTACPFRENCSITRVLTKNAYEREHIATMADPSTEPASDGAAMGVTEPDHLRALTEGIGAIQDEKTKEFAQGAFDNILKSIETGIDVQDNLKKEITGLKEKNKQLSVEGMKLKEAQAQNIGDLVIALGELQTLVLPNSDGEDATFTGTETEKMLLEAPPIAVRPISTLVSASLAMLRGRKRSAESGDDERYNRMRKAISNFGEAAATHAGHELGLVQSSRAAKRSRPDNADRPRNSTQQALQQLLDRHRMHLEQRTS